MGFTTLFFLPSLFIVKGEDTLADKETKDIRRAPERAAADGGTDKQGASVRQMVGELPLPPGMIIPDGPSTTRDVGDTSGKATKSMTKEELVSLAEENGVTVETDDNKDDLVRKINAN